ncbi:MAG: hypothetical protein AB8G05_25540 [Oligoflexales bacterium]
MAAQSDTQQLANTVPGIPSQGMDQGQLPHPIVELAEYPFRVPLTWWIALAVIILAVVLGLLIWRWYKKKNEVHYAPRSEPPLLLMLRSLEAQKPPSPFPESMHCDYFFTLSMAFRQILEQAYSFPATDLTLKELKKPLEQRVKFKGYDRSDMIKFFERCDLIKFAKAPTHENEAMSYHTQVMAWAKAIVDKSIQDQTTPKSHKQMSPSLSQ